MALRRYRKPKIKKIKGKRQAEKRAAKLGISAEEMISQKKGPTDVPKEPETLLRITLPEVVPIKLLSQKIGQPVTTIISKLFESGVAVTINESVDFETAAILADEFGVRAEKEKVIAETPAFKSQGSKKEIIRSPIVTVMGHVDHGKTKLLDAIRKTNVLEGESGGITQHIGAYQTKVQFADKGKKKHRVITFLDTPGHEAFSAMRAQGARVTDIVILVVAADDGVKPQTQEAISHAHAAKVPIIVAINKIDKPEANVERTKHQLAEFGLLPEEWGGKTVMIEISAKQGTNIQALLEMVVLTAEMLDLKVPSDTFGRGTVIESKTKPGVGPVATVIVETGEVKTGDYIVLEDSYCKIRFMQDFTGNRIEKALPAQPVQIAGLKILPKVSSRLQVVPDEKTAKEILGEIQKYAVAHSIKAVSLAQASKDIRIEKTQILNLIIKADVAGSLEAIESGLSKISAKDAQIKVIHKGIGAISESDINLATAASAVVVGFNTNIPLTVQKLADQNGIQIATYDVIYKLLDDIVLALEGILKPEIVETKVGSATILKVFFSTQTNGIIGVKVLSGLLRPHQGAWILRKENKLGPIKVQTLKIGQTEVNEVKENQECGIGYEGPKLKVGDKLEVFERQEIMPEVTKG